MLEAESVLLERAPSSTSPAAARPARRSCVLVDAEAGAKADTLTLSAGAAAKF